MNEKISFTNGSSRLTISVTGYENPESTDQSDANWLIVEMNLMVGERQFRKAWPALEAGDLDGIASWFQSLASRRLPDWVHLIFTEPNLGFEVYRATDDFVRIGVHLSHEFQPPFVVTSGIEDAVCCVELEYAELARMTASFQRISEQFPNRQFPLSKDKMSQHYLRMASSRFP